MVLWVLGVLWVLTLQVDPGLQGLHQVLVVLAVPTLILKRHIFAYVCVCMWRHVCVQMCWGGGEDIVIINLRVKGDFFPTAEIIRNRNEVQINVGITTVEIVWNFLNCTFENRRQYLATAVFCSASA